VKNISGSKGFMWFIIILGAISGSILGEILGNNISQLALLKAAYTIGTTAPLVLDLKVLVLTFGLQFHINIMTIIGTILAIIIYRRY